ncbi:MAG: site-2 protease family protein [Clostridia bacterium]
MFFTRFFSTDADNIGISIIVALAFLIAVVFSIMVHEISHGYAALKSGDPTAKARGRLSLNPVSHFDLFGVLMFLLVGFGWAKPVPIDSRNFTNYKKGMILVSIAGVSANLIMAGISMLLLYIFIPFLYTLSTNAVIVVLQYLGLYLLIYMIAINFMLAFFNLLPIYPLDGYNLLNTLLPNNTKYQMFMVRYGIFVLIGLILIGRVAEWLGFPYLNIFGMFSDLIYNIIQKIMLARLGG